MGCINIGKRNVSVFQLCTISREFIGCRSFQLGFCFIWSYCHCHRYNSSRIFHARNLIFVIRYYLADGISIRSGLLIGNFIKGYFTVSINAFCLNFSAILVFQYKFKFSWTEFLITLSLFSVSGQIFINYRLEFGRSCTGISNGNCAASFRYFPR